MSIEFTIFNVRCSTRGFGLRLGVLLALLTLIWPGTAPALGPHEVLVLANASSPDSVMVAKTFAELRRVPSGNIVRLGLPAFAGGNERAISPADFESQILRPAQRIAQERGIADHILAWVYSTDFPTLVKTDPVMSLQGYTFLRGRLPDADRVVRGTYESPLFAGPSGPAGAGHFPQSFDVYAQWLGTNMPLPSMALGVRGPRGNSVDEILATLRRGCESDYAAPTGTVYFVLSDDVRSRCRAWQFPRVSDELRVLGVASAIGAGFPRRAEVIGLMMGAATVKPAGNLYLPGCMAEHLTSLAGAFQDGAQTKLSAWLSAGATASAGTVVEPMAIWQKFPHARFFVHYAAGCTMMEAFYQSIKSPLQILLVGDPLAQPWAPRVTIELPDLPSTVSESLIVSVAASDGVGGHYGKFMHLVDGRAAGSASHTRIDTRLLTPGRHTLRVVAVRTGLVRVQGFVEKAFTVARGEGENSE